MTVTAKLFMSGRSQAIRLPAKLRLDAKEVRIEQVGNALWVQPEPSPDQSMADWLRSFYEATEALPDTFLADRNDSPPQTRDWS
ncbi:MAG TPA: AbrB family transcriptional regulator [Polaromonas sp.]|uniref:antitoxin n=1 Tax=Polaromonas sp. UBA4122 TaxID=1947074 RepID=UPI000EF03709|nr:AbrB/MazE/SpoVT family DNA-binding domain-containing protein [Polaromonas sp. UBA4122]HAL39250.1 AbrB family transcriptional regulator [Polaromonas sp.]